jgi:MYXO-CTERM domain-containing protein
VLPFAAVMLSWQPVAALNPSTGTFMRAIPQATEAWLRLDLHFSALYWIARFTSRQAIDPGVWGAALPLVVVLAFLAWRRRSLEKQSSAFMLLGAAVAVGIWCVAYFYLSSYLSDVKYLLGTSVNRIFMPFWVLLLLSALFLDTHKADET